MCFSVTVDTERCKGCGLCVEACPRQLIAMSQSLNSSGIHVAEFTSQDNCTGCVQCATICPDAAIEIEKYNEGTEKKRRRSPPHDRQ